MGQEESANLEWSASGKQMLKTDREFLDLMLTIIDNNISSNDLNVEFIEQKMNYTHSTLFRKVKRITGMSCRDILIRRKMEYSIRILNEGGNVSEAAYACGFNDPGYFRLCFFKTFGILPSHYIKCIKKGEKPDINIMFKSDVKLT